MNFTWYEELSCDDDGALKVFLEIRQEKARERAMEIAKESKEARYGSGDVSLAGNCGTRKD